MRPALLLGLLLAGCTPGASSDADLAQQLAAGLATACPDAPADDDLARNECSAALTDFPLLRESTANPFLWGQQLEENVWNLDDHVTRFDPRVFRRMYLSLYSFPKEHQVEQLADGTTLLRIKARFRNGLDMGSYPYPFWHKLSKWESYQLAEEVIFFIKDRKLLGGRRSFQTATDHSYVVHEFGGQWTWREGGEQMPYVVLYSYFFSKQNPHVTGLDAAYRELEFGLRKHNCLICHSPDNGPQMPKLELFNYPNQALSGRKRIVEQLEKNLMPTEDPARGFKQGMTDDAARKELLELAKKFSKLGDEAMGWEGERN